MGNMLNLDSGFSKFMNRVSDLFLLNILWIVCSIPIITIGASTTALYSVDLNLLSEDEGHITKSFFKAFKEHFKKSIVLCINLVFWLKCGLSIAYIALPFIFFAILVFLLVSPYIFPVLSKSNSSILSTIKYCFFISIKALPYSLLITLFGLSVLFATFYFPIVFLFMILLGVAVHSYMVSRIFLIVYNKNNNHFSKILS